ncbi:Nuclear actin-protein involved in chromatin remodeling [Orbilia blumenaviensis]|uniref:Nuclear actin-protein involved in chromatin remodeling n=1 Tax=Orbilia blumenaviensis TaxID=1796055 RepID=A0AAV9V781_9PEZI
MSPTATEQPSSPSSPNPPPKLYYVYEPKFPGSTPQADDYSKYRGDENVAVVIDNGSWNTRVGWSTESAPRIAFPPICAKYRDRKLARTFTLVGNDAYADSNSRTASKNAFDVNVVSNFDVMENILDYSFLKLGIDDDEGIGHPVVMTEALCNPTYSRKTMSELLFEAYHAPSVTYGLDSLFSYHYNGGNTGLVLSSSHTTTHLIPVVNGKGILSMATRLNWGCSQAVEFLTKLLALKYPGFPKTYPQQMESLVQEHCYVSQNYKAEMSGYLEMGSLDERDRAIQFPFTEIVKEQKSEEELARIAERRKESGRRLQEQAAKMRLEKLKKKEEELLYYQHLLERGKTETKKNLSRLLENEGFRDEAQLEKRIKELEKSIRRSRNKDLGIEEEEEEEIPTFPLLDTPDEDLDEDGIKQKKAQRLLKANYEARLRLRVEKEKERERLRLEAEKEEERRANDLEGWISEKRSMRDGLVAKLKEREQRKTQLSDRKSLASLNRMKAIAHLASDEPTRKRRRGNDEDTFGADDDDWAIYRDIATVNEDEEEEDEEMQTELKSIEAQLLRYDPNFTEDSLQGAGTDWSKSLIHAFLRGCRPFDPENQAEANQMHLNVERIRVPEVIFEPSMAGIDQAGIVEVASELLLNRITEKEQRESIYKDIFLTGGYALFQGFEERLRTTIMSVLPFEAEFGVRTAKDPLLDAWKGAALWSKTNIGGPIWEGARITRADFDEKGSDYIKEHNLGNVVG